LEGILRDLGEQIPWLSDLAAGRTLG